MGMVNGVLSFRVSAVLDSVNITIWKGTTIEKMQSVYRILQNLESTRAMYQAAMEQQMRISTVESTVIRAL